MQTELETREQTECCRNTKFTFGVPQATACIILGVLAAVLFGLMGNTHEPELYGPSIASWLCNQWTLANSKSAHGWLIPCVSLYFVWRRRRELLAVEKKPEHRALVIIALALLLYWAGCRTQQPRLGFLCFVALSWAVPLFCLGTGTARLLLFPCAYLIFAMPLGFLSAITFPLRLISCRASVGILNGLGFRTYRVGTAILSGGNTQFALDVADPCSGLHSLIAMTALTAGYAHLTQKTLIRKWILFFCAFPLAMAGNITRIVIISVAARVFGLEVAMTIYHDYSVYIVFVSAILLMTAVGTLLNRLPRAEAGGRLLTADHGLLTTDLSDMHFRSMRRPSMLAALFLATILAVHFTGRPGLTRGPRIRMELPEVVGDWRGESLFYCQGETCMVTFVESDLTDTTLCPACGSLLDTISLGERRGLPQDTVIVRKQYRSASDKKITVSVVVTGSQRASIHRPQWCLPGQGLKIESSRAIDIGVPGRGPLQAMLLELTPEGGPRRRRTAGHPAYAYWFVGENRETVRHEERLFWMAWENLVRNTRYRWAYIAVAYNRPSRSPLHLPTMTGFISQLYPMIDSPPAEPDTRSEPQ